MDIQNFDVSDEWDKNNRLREITKQNRTIIAENEDLRFSLEKSEKKLSTLSKEYDKLAVELTNARNGYQSQTESLSSFREEIQRKAENSSKNAQISDRELNILREEYRTIKSAYDKIIARWQKMYEDVYEELEKVRAILLAEHELNNRLREELKQKKIENEDLQAKYENKLKELESELNRRNIQTSGIERALQSIANGNQILNNNLIYEGMNIELYIVQNEINYKLCSQATIPLKKLLSIKTQTNFRGEINFFAPNEDESQKGSTTKSSILLAKLSYNVKVPFSLLHALNAQRRRMAAATFIPLINNNENKDFNEEIESNNLVIQIHRCHNLDKLKGGEKVLGNLGFLKNGEVSKLLLNTFHREFHSDFSKFILKYMPKTNIQILDNKARQSTDVMPIVKNKANPIFDEINTWKLPINSEAIHKYLINEDLIIYLFEENSENIISLSSSATSRSLGYISIPLFPLARNQKIRGTFPLTDRADETITSGASIDISIFWQFAYVFDDTKLISNTQFVGGNKIVKEKDLPELTIKASNNMQIINETKGDLLKEIKENNQENDLIKEGNTDISSDDDEQNGEIEELKLRKRLFSNKIISEIVNNEDEQKINSDIEIKENNEEIYENNEENERNQDSESINLIKEELNALNEENPSSESRLSKIVESSKENTTLTPNDSPNGLAVRRAVEFSDPLHSSIPRIF
uniref:Uncharacterized protein n=1 Tax=Meloidogyne javanica TaxID=6303 RepID=A0A915MAX8_MELJA